tara:strand:- start:1799 stop:2200 length:402 start_codon:yes stop_codon:yes gene_type:complete
MKKLLFLFTALLFISCSGDDDSSSNDTSIDPPSWIQGVWMREDLEVFGYEFTKDDICSVSFNTKTCQKASIDMWINAPNVEVNVYEEISDDRYFIEITYFNYTSQLEFIKVSSTRIKLSELLAEVDIFYTLQQ